MSLGNLDFGWWNMSRILNIFFHLNTFRAILMDSKIVDQLVIWQAGQQQVFSQQPATIHLTIRPWQRMGKLSQLI